MRFDPGDGNTPTQSTVKTGTLASPPENNPVREGFRFDGWTREGQPYDFQTPVLQDTTLKAKWSKATDWTLSPDHGPASGTRLTISPPSLQEPYYVSVQAAGDQFIGLTGEGRIYTWAQDNTPKQVPLPAQAPDGFRYLQAPDGFRYLQAAAGSHRQAALGSDQHIYTWTSQEATPTLLDTGQDAGFTSISMSDDRLLAVDRQGQVHAFQAGMTGNQNEKLTEQATTVLPEQAQATLAVASPSRILALDSDGQAWIWNPDKTGNVKPERIRQDQGMRIRQAQTLSQGFILLDANGQAHYLADGKTSLATTGLPENMKASRITANKNQAVTAGTDGHIWTWKPGETPTRADNGSQPYTQAAITGGRITAISRQGSLYQWSINTQSQPDKPAKVNTTQAAILESASLDGRSLTLNKTDGSWQTEMPASQPGPATILITGKQDGKPFTKSLNYTVDQTLLKDIRQSSTYTVTFKTDGGSPKPGDQQVTYPYGRVQRPSPDPTRSGYQFDGWFIGEVAYDFSKPVTENLTLNAKWTSKTPNTSWRISPDKGSQLGHETTTITPPDSTSGIRFSQVGGAKYYTYVFSLAVGSDGNAYAWGDNTYGQLGDGTTTQRITPNIVRKPAGVPTDFTYVQVSAGKWHSLAVGSDGYVYAWGSNQHGQLGNNTATNSSVPVRVRDPTSPTDPNKGLKAIQVSAGDEHSLALDSNGYVYAWGWNDNGRLGNNTTADSSFPVRVRDPTSSTDPSKGLKAVQVSAGWHHSLAVGNDGYTYDWGLNNYGQLGNTSKNSSTVPVRVRDPTSPTDANKGLKATQVSAGYSHSLAVGSDGYTYAWGLNNYGQLGNSNTADSTVPVRVRDPASPKDTSKGLKATAINAGGEHSLAVGSNGYAYAWGWNLYRQLGDGTTSNSSVPVPVRDPTSPADASKGLQATRFSVGDHHSLAVGSNGYTYAWGENIYGQLGDGTTDDSNVPVSVLFNLQPVITAARFDTGPGTNLAPVSNSSSVTVLTPAHQPGAVTVSVDYAMGGAGRILTDTSLRYTYLPAGVLPRAGEEGILLALATGMTGMGGVMASRRHRRERHRLLHTSHE
ncbi:InlB B-repeat-containing protein [Bifidobacterium sp. W8109]|nr:InlB B-repeat-containing protein [Bifidobacterium asteroides]MBI0073423.1 InlB B-repeat-containing protein [Bifidobacterium sp. W8110]PXY89126.1 chromosome condensation regulator RCC1 [Bifidobacterium asteroides]